MQNKYMKFNFMDYSLWLTAGFIIFANTIYPVFSFWHYVALAFFYGMYSMLVILTIILKYVANKLGMQYELDRLFGKGAKTI